MEAEVKAAPLNAGSIPVINTDAEIKCVSRSSNSSTGYIIIFTTMNVIYKIFIRIVLIFSLALAIQPRLSAGEDAPEGGDPGQTTEFLRILILEPGGSCVTDACHEGLNKRKYIHAIGVDGMKCSRCHEMTDDTKHVFKKIPPVTKPLCEQCHSETMKPPPGIGKTPPQVISEEADLILHAPFQEGKCTACHDAHGSDYYRHLKSAYPEGVYATFTPEAYGLCISCHKEILKSVTEPRTLTSTLFRNGNINLHFRHVNKAKGRSCSVCHHPHGLKNPMLMNTTFQFGNRLLTISYDKTETGGQCATSCHRLAMYDRYKPALNMIKSTPIPGEQASESELEQSRKDDLEHVKEKENITNEENR